MRTDLGPRMAAEALTPPAAPEPVRRASGLLSRRWPERRLVVLAVAVVLLVAVLATARAVDRQGAALAALATVPIMLVALELGIGGGLAAAAIAVLGVVISDAAVRPEVGTLDTAARSAVLVAVAVVCGRFSGRMRAAREREEALLRSGLALGAASSDEEIAGLAAAAAMRMPGVGGAGVAVDGARPVARGRRAARSTRAAIAVRGTACGEITVFHDGPLPAEECAALELLAVQAAQAVEQIRARERERERAALDAELERVRVELLDERSALGRLLGAQEAERRRVAATLQEQLAQVLAAVLMGLRVLEHGTSGRGAAPVDALRAQVTEALLELRALAATLRPPSVEHLGLAAALRSLAAEASSDAQALSVRVAGDADGLSDALATGTYRILEDALAAAPDSAITADVLVEGRRLTLDLRLPGAAHERALAPIRARVELLGGVLEVTPAGDGATLTVVRLGEGAHAVARP